MTNKIKEAVKTVRSAQKKKHRIKNNLKQEVNEKASGLTVETVCLNKTGGATLKVNGKLNRQNINIIDDVYDGYEIKEISAPLPKPHRQRIKLGLNKNKED